MRNEQTNQLLAEIELLPYTARRRRLVEIGRRAKRDAAAAASIEELGASPQAFHRLLALETACGSGDGARVAAAIADPSRTVRQAAAGLVPFVCDDDQAAAALGSILQRRLLRRTVQALSRLRRTTPVDTFLAGRLEKDPEPNLVDLLAWGSPSLVERFALRLEDGGENLAWRHLARRHPAFAARFFRARLAAGEELDWRWRPRIETGLEDLARQLPDDALALLRLYLERGAEPRRMSKVLRQLVPRRPRDVFDLLRERHAAGRETSRPGIFGLVSFHKAGRVLGAERLAFLVRHAPTTLGEGRRGVDAFLRLGEADRRAVLEAFLAHGHGIWGAFLFRYLSREGEEGRRRAAAFENWSRAARDREGVIQLDLLDALPHDLRELEVRRHLAEVAALEGKPEQRMAYARLLSFAAARELLQVFLGHPEGDVRAWAQRAWLGSLRLDREALPAGLAAAKGRRFEQDPVRQGILETFASLPATRFGREHLPEIGAILQDALDAADLSPATSAAAEAWVFRLFRLDGEWGARWLGKLLEVRGKVSAWGLGAALTKGEAAHLAPALAGLVQSWTSRERASAIIALASSLGDRLKEVPPLLESLETLARGLPFIGVAAQALRLLAKQDPRRFDRLVEESLHADRSFAMLGEVASHVGRRRQDLLPLLLEERPFEGRFASGRVLWVLDLGPSFGRWTERQQEAYADRLLDLLDQEAKDVPGLIWAVGHLFRLPFADTARILPLADEPRPPLRETAIRSLPWLDALQGVPVLIEALGDDRARWAIYALRKAFGEMERPRVLAALQAAPLGKVTVHKEVVRLLGELDGQDAYEELLRHDRPELHRDVRIALLRALWDHLGDERTWAVFERAVADPDWIVATKLTDIPLGRVNEAIEPKVVSLLARLLARPEPEARRDLLKRAAGPLQLSDRGRLLFRQLLAQTAAESPEEAAEALWAVLLRMKKGEAEEVAGRLRALLPRRRHFAAMLPKLLSLLRFYGRAEHWKVAELLAPALEADSFAAPLYLQLASRIEEPAGLAAAFGRLAERGLLSHDAMVVAVAAVCSSHQPGVHEKHLRRSPHWQVRRLGLEALVAASSPDRGWNDIHLQLLEIYRRDPSPGVAGPAAFVFPPVPAASA